MALVLKEYFTQDYAGLRGKDRRVLRFSEPIDLKKCAACGQGCVVNREVASKIIKREDKEILENTAFCLKS